MSKLVATISVDRKSIPAISLISVLLTGISVPYILWLNSAYSIPANVPRSANLDLFVAACVGILVVHELVHAIAYILSGAKPKFGAKLIAGFVPILTTSSKGTKLRLTRMLIVGLSPFVVISVATSLLAAIHGVTAYAIAAFDVNFVASAGDIFMVLSLIKYIRRQNVMIEDTGAAFKVLI